jgi:hypothetical protein
MIDDKTYKEVLESGLLLDHYFLLCNIKDGKKSVDTKRIQGFINLLTKKGYIQDDELTEKGRELIQGYEISEIIPLDTKGKTISGEDFEKWVEQLHAKCKERLRQLTGKPQFFMKVDKRDYPYLPGVKDLAMKIEKFIRVYKYTDLLKIEALILKHLESRNQKLIYYIMREKGDAKSDLAADYENFDESELGNSGENYKSPFKAL